ncbi:hypothetical protein Salat_0848800 [Sesamum alatum]|uniref:Uncharacterized protein n=1 Tax=Sesamum alatum TaxID=300844 RepID=A0AAE1YIK3_9LAMI|nr:hypothetical protein Salat_0848800 [Sesamum alatum]
MPSQHQSTVQSTPVNCPVTCPISTQSARRRAEELRRNPRRQRKFRRNLGDSRIPAETTGDDPKFSRIRVPAAEFVQSSTGAAEDKPGAAEDEQAWHRDAGKTRKHRRQTAAKHQQQTQQQSQQQQSQKYSTSAAEIGAILTEKTEICSPISVSQRKRGDLFIADEEDVDLLLKDAQIGKNRNRFRPRFPARREYNGNTRGAS